MKPKTLLDAPLTKELIDLLNELYPEKCPFLTQPERDIFFYAGQRNLVSLLTQAYNIQLNGISNDELTKRKADQLAGLSLRHPQ